MVNRRTFTLAALAAPMVAATAGRAETAAGTLDDDGLHSQPWLMQTFLDLGDDFAETSAAGKRFAILWEQKGCPYCREMPAVNLADPEIVEYIPAKDPAGKGVKMVEDFLWLLMKK